MDIAIKISALEEYCRRQEARMADMEVAAHAAGMLAGLKQTLAPGFDYEAALIEASYELQDTLASKSNVMSIERAVGYFSGIVFSDTHDIAEAQALGYAEKESLMRLLEKSG